MRLLVCGGRDYNYKEYLFSVLDKLLEEVTIDVVIEGGQHGADTLAKEWAAARGIFVIEEKANWTLYKRAAGPIRNKKMLEHHPDLVIAFPGQRRNSEYDHII